ncbi:MAG TPA: type II toxin-antitoxin system Phd/YefM family antitoxin [Dissulfurispiraceae bacterium]|nr:type II toxin-antitoxin system Phd/YefM family antitoxin [Dissulfurispiraceae bacterium]
MKTTAAATKLIDALQARVRFGKVMDEVENKNTRFLVSRRGKPKIVMLSINDYLKNVLKEQGLLAEIQWSAQETGLDRLTSKEIDAEIKAHRKGKKKRG